MAVPIYATSPSSMCSTPHQSYDFDLSSRSSSMPSSSSSQKPGLGGLSCLLSSTSRHSSSSSGFSCGEELGSLWHDRGEESKELRNSFRFSPNQSVGSSTSREQSPVSVFHGPLSWGSNGVGSSSKSPPTWISSARGGDFNFLGSIRGGTNGFFKGFLTKALGSCVDFDSSTLKVDNNDDMSISSSPLSVDELTFNMDDTSVESDYEQYAKDLLLRAQSRHKIFSDDLVIKAFYEAEKAHRGQMRASGDPFLQHCVETAILLALLGANSTVVAAGLLHDTLDDSFMTYNHIFGTFGAGIADLVKGVSKLSHLSKLARDNNTADRAAEADRLHTMFLAMVDARAVLIKLADRLHNMMTLDALPLSKQQRFAKETLEIFVPLTNRLGISTWREQMENMCFKHLNPDQHRDLSSKLVELFNEAIVTSAAEKLKQALEDQGISYHVLSGRHKSVYSLHSKMLKKRLTINEMHDIHGLRLIVENEEDCYKALRVVHQLWSKVHGKQKDYISQPKFNGYQSIHTVVTGEGRIPLEVQIRTKEMHLHAELGFASHWRYKEGDCKHSSFVFHMVEWARWVLTWHCETMSKDHSSIAYTDTIRPLCKFPSHSNDCSFSYNALCCQDGPLFVIIIDNFKMSVQELPVNSTVMDVIEGSGRGRNRLSGYGFPAKEEFRLKVNNEVVSTPNWKLKMGDVVELSPRILDMSLAECREEIQRMYDRGLTLSTQPFSAANFDVGFES